MSEIRELILPILQKLQADMTALRAKTNDIAEAQEGQGDKLAEIERYLTLQMGVTLQNKLDVEDIHKAILDLRKRVDRLESRS